MRKVLYVLTALVVFLAGTFAGQYAPVKEAYAQMCGGPGNCDFVGNMVVHGNLTVADGFDFISSDDFSSVDDMTVGDDLNVTDDLVSLDIYNTGDVGTSRATTVTVTNGGTVTTLAAVVPLTSSGNVGTSTISGCSAGATYAKTVTFWNSGSNTITFTDTGTLKLSGNIALGQTDTLMLRCDTGTGNWLQVATTNN